jgi:hypothetical protein
MLAALGGATALLQGPDAFAYADVPPATMPLALGSEGMRMMRGGARPLPPTEAMPKDAMFDPQVAALVLSLGSGATYSGDATQPKSSGPPRPLNPPSAPDSPAPIYPRSCYAHALRWSPRPRLHVPHAHRPRRSHTLRAYPRAPRQHAPRHTTLLAAARTGSSRGHRYNILLRVLGAALPRHVRAVHVDVALEHGVVDVDLGLDDELAAPDAAGLLQQARASRASGGAGRGVCPARWRCQRWRGSPVAGRCLGVLRPCLVEVGAEPRVRAPLTRRPSPRAARSYRPSCRA